MKGSFKTAVIAAVVSAFVAAGAAVATTQTLTLGTTNRVNAPTTVVNATSNGVTNPVDAPLLTLNNKSSTANATPLSLLAAPGHAPFKVNTGVEVTNLNADRLDGTDSSGFVQVPVGNAYSISKGDVTSCSGVGYCTGSLTLQNLPAGSYVAWAKIVLDDSSQGTGTNGFSFAASCTLTAGSDMDTAKEEILVVPVGGARQATFPLQVVHSFASSGGSVALSCQEGPWTGAWQSATVTAIRVGSLSNVTG